MSEETKSMPNQKLVDILPKVRMDTKTLANIRGILEEFNGILTAINQLSTVGFTDEQLVTLLSAAIESSCGSGESSSQNSQPITDKLANHEMPANKSIHPLNEKVEYTDPIIHPLQ